MHDYIGGFQVVSVVLLLYNLKYLYIHCFLWELPASFKKIYSLSTFQWLHPSSLLNEPSASVIKLKNSPFTHLEANKLYVILSCKAAFFHPFRTPHNHTLSDCSHGNFFLRWNLIFVCAFVRWRLRNAIPLG